MLAPLSLLTALLLGTPTLSWGTLGAGGLSGIGGSISGLGANNATPVLGPVADLVVTNGNISPDGFERAVVLAGGQFPSPLILAEKVRLWLFT